MKTITYYDGEIAHTIESYVETDSIDSISDVWPGDKSVAFYMNDGSIMTGKVTAQSPSTEEPRIEVTE